MKHNEKYIIHQKNGVVAIVDDGLDGLKPYSIRCYQFSEAHEMQCNGDEGKRKEKKNIENTQNANNL